MLLEEVTMVAIILPHVYFAEKTGLSTEMRRCDSELSPMDMPMDGKLRAEH